MSGAVSTSDTSSWLKNTPSNISMANNYSMLFEFRITADISGSFFAQVGAQLYVPGVSTRIQFYRYSSTDGTHPNKLAIFYRTTGGSSQEIYADIDIVNNAWYHACWTVDGSGNAFVYVLQEGFNPSSPSYLFATPSRGGVQSSPDTASVWIQGSNDSANSKLNGIVQHARILLIESYLTEAQALAAFAQRAPTAPISGVDYNSINLIDASAVQTDIGNSGQNWTKTGIGFADIFSEPSEWSARSNSLFFGAGSVS